MTSLYDILGVTPSASPAQIKAGYRKAAMRWHPDRNPDNKEVAERRFKELGHAYSVLSDPVKRREYDESMQRPDGTAHDAAAADEQSADDVFLQAMVEFAMQLARRGYNVDVLFGALISQGCPERVARLIADRVVTQAKEFEQPKRARRAERSDTHAADGSSAAEAVQGASRRTLGKIIGGMSALILILLFFKPPVEILHSTTDPGKKSRRSPWCRNPLNLVERP